MPAPTLADAHALAMRTLLRCGTGQRILALDATAFSPDAWNASPPSRP
jgi:hypothetical protein